MKELQLKEILAELDVQVTGKSPQGWLVAQCPFAEYKHDSGRDRNPSFFAKIESSGLSGFICQTCKSHGRISSLVRQLEHFRQEKYGNLAIRADLAETPDSFDDFEKSFDINIDPDPINKAAHLSMYPLAWEDKRSRAYLEGRGISKATSLKLQLQYDDEECRILFPVFDFREELYGFSGRSILSNEEIAQINKSGKLRIEYSRIKDYLGLPKHKLLLGEHLIDKVKPLWVLEGLFAYAHFIEIGAQEVCNPVATLGSNLSSYQRDLLIDYGLPIYLGYDPDSAGDIGIYGQTDREGEHIGGGAYDMLKDQVPTFVPTYPWERNDPDYLTFDDVVEMMQNIS